MSEQLDTMDTQKTVVTCESNVDISIAVDLHNYLKQALQGNQMVEIDAGKVERIDTSVLQLIYSYITAAREQGLQVDWSAASDAVYSSARLIGLDKLLQLPEVAD